MLPVMMAEGAFSFSQLSGLPAATMRGIWLAVCYFRLGISPAVAPTPISVGFCPGERLLILAMAWLPPFILVLLIRFWRVSPAPVC